MRITSITIAVPVADANAALGWYRLLFAGHRELHPVPGVAEIAFDDQVWLQVMDPGGDEVPAHILRIGVCDLDAEVIRLRALGIAIQAPRLHPLAEGGCIALADLVDPDGNRLCFYELRETI